MRCVCIILVNFYTDFIMNLGMYLWYFPQQKTAEAVALNRSADFRLHMCQRIIRLMKNHIFLVIPGLTRYPVQIGFQKVLDPASSAG